MHEMLEVIGNIAEATGFSGHNLGSAVISVWEKELETFKRGTGRFYEQACLVA